MPAPRYADHFAATPRARRTGRRRVEAVVARPARAPGPAGERWAAPAGSRRSRRDTRRRARRRRLAASGGRQTGPTRHRSRSIRLVDEDERRSLHDRCARAHERDVDVLHLTLSGAPRGLQRSLDDVPETVDAPGAQTAAERVQWQLAVELDPPVLDEIERLALLAEAVRLEAIDDRRREAVVDLRDVDVLRREARPLPRQARRAAAALHVARQAADAARDLERQTLAVAGEVGRARPEVTRALGGGQDDGDRALYRDVAVVETERVGDHARAEIVLARQRLPAEVGMGILVRMTALRDGERRHLLPALSMPLQPARVRHGHALSRPAESIGRGELRGPRRVGARQILIGALGIVHRAPDHGVLAHAGEQRVDGLLDSAADVHGL